MPTPTYCTVADISDFLRVPITATTTPNKTQVEKLIIRKEEELDRRIGHTFGRSKQVTEVHDLPLLYTYGWGTPIYLRHRNCRDLDGTAGDKIEIWDKVKYQQFFETFSPKGFSDLANEVMNRQEPPAKRD